MKSRCDNQQIVIVGNGALGLALAAYLSKLPNAPEVTVFGRAGIWRKTAKISDFGESTVLDFTETRTNTSFSSPVIVFFATKAFALESAIAMHAKHFPEGSVLIPLCNGRIDDILLAAATNYPQFIWRRGVTTVAASFANDQTLNIRNRNPEIIWGPLSTKSDAGISLIEQNLTQYQGLAYAPNILPIVVKKWLANVVINSLCTAFSLPRNGLLQTMKFNLKPYIEEAINLAAELWPNCSKFELQQTHEYINDLITKTAENENSMVADCNAFRRNESFYLAGQAVGKGHYPLLKNLHATLG